MFKKLLPILALLASSLRCPAPIPYIVSANGIGTNITITSASSNAMLITIPVAFAGSSHPIGQLEIYGVVSGGTTNILYIVGSEINGTPGVNNETNGNLYFRGSHDVNGVGNQAVDLGGIDFADTANTHADQREVVIRGRTFDSSAMAGGQLDLETFTGAGIASAGLTIFPTVQTVLGFNGSAPPFNALPPAPFYNELCNASFVNGALYASSVNTPSIIAMNPDLTRIQVSGGSDANMAGVYAIAPAVITKMEMNCASNAFGYSSPVLVFTNTTTWGSGNDTHWTLTFDPINSQQIGYFMLANTNDWGAGFNNGFSLGSVGNTYSTLFPAYTGAWQALGSGTGPTSVGFLTNIAAANITGSLSVNKFPPSAGTTAANFQFAGITNGNLLIPATYLSAGYPNQISNNVQPGIAFIGTNSANYIAGQISCLADHNGAGQSELFFGAQAQIADNPSALNPNNFGYRQFGVENYPMEAFIAADGFFNAAGYNDLWTSNTIGHSYGFRFPAWWNNTNAGGTLIASGRASPGIVGVATSNTNMAPGAPASIGTGGGALEFYSVLPYSTGVFTYSNVPGTKMFRMDTNVSTVFGGLQVNTDDRNGNSSTVAFNLRNGDAGFIYDSFGFNSGFVQVGGGGGGQSSMTFGVVDNSGSYNKVFLVNGADGIGQSAGHGAYFNQALALGTNSSSTYGFGLEVYGNGAILSSNSSGFTRIGSGGITNSGAFTNSGAVNLGSTLTVQGGNVITGNGAGLTNLSAAFSNSFTNWVIGQINTNSSGRPWFVQSDALLTPAAVAGAVDMVLEVSDGNGHGRTNTTGFATTALSIVMSYTNGLSGIVPSGYGFTFTNRSSGAGNSAALVPKSGTLLDY